MEPVFSFINIYFQPNENRIQFAFQQWMGIQYNYFPIIALILIIVGTVLLTTKSVKKKRYPINYPALRSMLTWLSILIIGICVNYILFNFGLQQNILELINLIVAIICLNQLSKLFYLKEKLTWFHPTTRSSFFISAANFMYRLAHKFMDFATIIFIISFVPAKMVVTRASRQLRTIGHFSCVAKLPIRSKHVVAMRFCISVVQYLAMEVSTTTFLFSTWSATSFSTKHLRIFTSVAISARRNWVTWELESGLPEVLVFLQ